MGSFNPDINPPAAMAPEIPGVKPPADDTIHPCTNRWIGNPVFIGGFSIGAPRDSAPVGGDSTWTVTDAPTPPTTTVAKEPLQTEDTEVITVLEQARDIGPGDVVWSAATGNGPFLVLAPTLVNLVIEGKRKSDRNWDTLNETGRVEGWIVKDKFGRCYELPLIELTSQKPKRHIALIVWTWLMYIINIRGIWKQNV